MTESLGIAVAEAVASFSGICLIYAVSDPPPEPPPVPAGQNKTVVTAAGERSCLDVMSHALEAASRCSHPAQVSLVATSPVITSLKLRFRYPIIASQPHKHLPPPAGEAIVEPPTTVNYLSGWPGLDEAGQPIPLSTPFDTLHRLGNSNLKCRHCPNAREGTTSFFFFLRI